MSKKRGKKRKRQSNVPGKVGPAAASVKSVSPQKTSRGFDPDYSYVVHDLKRIGALAGSFIVILIVLSLFLR